MTATGANALFESLVKNQSLIYLNLEGNENIGDINVKLEYLSVLISTNEKLKTLNLN